MAKSNAISTLSAIIVDEILEAAEGGIVEQAASLVAILGEVGIRVRLLGTNGVAVDIREVEEAGESKEYGGPIRGSKNV
jgi:hypothetical protein